MQSFRAKAKGTCPQICHHIVILSGAQRLRSVNDHAAVKEKNDFLAPFVHQQESSQPSTTYIFYGTKFETGAIPKAGEAARAARSEIPIGCLGLD